MITRVILREMLREARDSALDAEHGWAFAVQSGCLVLRHETLAPNCLTVPLAAVRVMHGSPAAPPKLTNG